MHALQQVDRRKDRRRDHQPQHDHSLDAGHQLIPASLDHISRHGCGHQKPQYGKECQDPAVLEGGHQLIVSMLKHFDIIFKMELTGPADGQLVCLCL